MQEKKTKSLKSGNEAGLKKPVASKVRPGASVKRAVKTAKPTLSEAVGKSVARPKPLVVKVKPKIQPEKVKKDRKPKAKLIRDSFKFPEAEYGAFDALKSRCLAQGHAVKKSELVRAGLLALASMTDEELVKRLASVEKLKTGRPAS